MDSQSVYGDHLPEPCHRTVAEIHDDSTSEAQSCYYPEDHEGAWLFVPRREVFQSTLMLQAACREVIIDGVYHRKEIEECCRHKKEREKR